MRQFTFRDLHLQLEEIQKSAATSPVVVLDRGEPQWVMMSVDEFRRLKIAAGESIPSAMERPGPTVRRGPLIDPLGYETGDVWQVALEMADAAESGRNREAVKAEIIAVERRLEIS